MLRFFGILSFMAIVCGCAGKQPPNIGQELAGAVQFIGLYHPHDVRKH